MAQAEQQNISPAFANPPSTAQMFRKQYMGSEAAQAAGTPQEAAPPQQQVGTPPPVPPQIVVPPPRNHNPIMPDPNRAQAQPQVAPPPAGGQSDGVASPPVAPQTAPIPADASLQRQLESERQIWAQEKQQWQAVVQQQNAMLQQAAQMQQEYTALKQQEALAQQLSSDELFNGLTTVDTDDARRLVQLTAQTLQQPLDNMRQELQKQQQLIGQQQQYIDAQVYRMQQAKASQELQDAHPDFAQLVHDPNFIQFARQRDGYTSRSREQTAWEEFNRGNSSYVINMVNEFKGIQPNVAPLQSAPPVQVATSAVTPEPQAQAAPRFTLAELNSLMQMRQITPDQYRVYLNEYRQFQNAQPPQ